MKLRIDHIGVIVADLDQAVKRLGVLFGGDVDVSIAALRANGFKPMAGFPRQGAHGKVAFFHPDPISGLLFEVCQGD